ncbi:MAG: hypothetical protein US76_01525 [Parcubacteria group bacterium GW2011_GWA2_38_13b]|nr:MAG: hypothetical protein US76_01525 [Parcubacteria group bacterium GW2011_GWA2_38_13b]
MKKKMILLIFLTVFMVFGPPVFAGEKTSELVSDVIGPPACTVINFGRYDEKSKKNLNEMITGLNHRVDADPYEELMLEYGSYGQYRFGNELFIKSSLSGVIISESGRVLTLAHGVGPESDNVIYVAWSYSENGPRMLYQARILRANMALDVAELEIIETKIKFPYVVWGDSSEVKTGDDVFIISSPLGMPFTFNRCEVAHSRRTRGLLKALFNFNAPCESMMQLSGNLPGGSSGGPVFNVRGHLLGFVQSRIEKEPISDRGGASGGEESKFSGKNNNPPNINFVLPANEVRKWLEGK